MATTSQPVADFTVNSVGHTLSQVDAGSVFVSLPAVLAVLSSLQVRDSSLIRDAGLDKKSEIPAIRERWEIFSGRFAAMGIAADLIRKLPVVSGVNLMGEKPILDALEDARESHRRLAHGFAARSCDPMERKPGFVDGEWHRHDGISRFLSDFLKRFVGSAEEQPTPREESRPVIGTGIACDTGRGESISPVADALIRCFGLLSAPDLVKISDAVLDLIESKGITVGWSAVD